jgi:urease accessory protein
MTSNLAWIASRLVPLGQTTCLQMIATLETTVEDIAILAMGASLDDLGSCTLLADLASLQHEQLAGRVCQT